jgi:hypothetical protein
MYVLLDTGNADEFEILVRISFPRKEGNASGVNEADNDIILLFR